MPDTTAAGTDCTYAEAIRRAGQGAGVAALRHLRRRVARQLNRGRTGGDSVWAWSLLVARW